MDNTDKVEKEINIAGFSFKLTNRLIVIVIAVAPVVGGAFWGAFEAYNDYMGMRSAIKSYVSPDLSEFDKRLAVIEENSQKTTDYTRDIKNDIKQDLRRLESVVEQVERGAKQSQRETEKEVREFRKEVDNKIKKALDNPLAEK
jgi:hypothetical protein